MSRSIEVQQERLRSLLDEQGAHVRCQLSALDAPTAPVSHEASFENADLIDEEVEDQMSDVVLARHRSELE